MDLMLQHRSLTPHSDLQLLKQAMKLASAEISKQNAHAKAASTNDKLSVAMAFLRSADKGDVVGQIRNAGVYSHLANLADPKDPFLRESASMNLV